MEVKTGYIYHIKDEYFAKGNDKKLIKNNKKKNNKDYNESNINYLKKYYLIKSVVLDNEILEKYVVMSNSLLYIKVMNINKKESLNIDLRLIDINRYEVISEIDYITFKNMKLLDELRNKNK